ncbi:hypothetical protein [Pseudomonas sp.]|uniref:hypothetical protein n=1 Tax=Pseudomonas sp. TaxID=306 RepID=UPI003FD74DDF
MDSGGGMSQGLADTLYQPQLAVVDLPAADGVTLNTGDQNGKGLLLVISPAGAIAGITIGMPSNPKLGQQFDICIPQFAVAALMLTAPGMTVLNAPASLAAGNYVSFRYVKANFWARAN